MGASVMRIVTAVGAASSENPVCEVRSAMILLAGNQECVKMRDAEMNAVDTGSG